ncbi:MAG: nuclear transport factor 2 family protein [Acidimicrobiia bacterium]|nr:nuclear transport factor 2 family protein [Acidimicrobiia bacterium]
MSADLGLPPADAGALAERFAIDEIVSCYAAGLDSQDWDLWRSIFVPEPIFDMTSVHGRPAQRASIDTTIALVRTQFAGFAATQHVIVNRRHTLDGDRARVLATMQAWHWIDERCYTMFGYYDDRLVRTAAGWRLDHVQLNLTRTEGDPKVMGDAFRKGRALLDS